MKKSLYFLSETKFFVLFTKKILVVFLLLNTFNVLHELHGYENISSGMDSNGNTIVVWQENTALGTEVKASALPIASVWETPVTLSTTYIASFPVLEVANNGSDTFAAVIWTESIGGIVHLYGAMRPSLSGAWTAPTLISDGIEDVSSGYRLVMNSAGTIVANWSSFSGSTYQLRASRATINNMNTWGAPVTVL